MNNKGVITRGMAILAALILLIVIIVFISIRLGSKNNIKRYKEFESELVSAAENYYVIKKLDIDEGEEKKIKLDELLSVSFIDNKLIDKCNAYVIIANENDISTDEYNIEYRAYIKCSNKYMTTNYSEY